VNFIINADSELKSDDDGPLPMKFLVRPMKYKKGGLPESKSPILMLKEDIPSKELKLKLYELHIGVDDGVWNVIL
jgi:hypothetical protein